MAASDHKRVAFSPAEFAALFGKSQTWGYRQIYAGKVTAITEHGRILIPALEVERILASAGIYEGMPKPPKHKDKPKSPSSEHHSVWQRFVELRRKKSADAIPGRTGLPNKAKRATSKNTRAAIPGRISRAWTAKTGQG